MQTNEKYPVERTADFLAAQKTVSVEQPFAAVGTCNGKRHREREVKTIHTWNATTGNATKKTLLYEKNLACTCKRKQKT